MTVEVWINPDGVNGDVTITGDEEVEVVVRSGAEGEVIAHRPAPGELLGRWLDGRAGVRA